MESGEVLEHPSVVDARGSLCNGNGVQRTDKFEEIENPGVDFLNDFESYWEYIKDGLTISRMVNDSVIKGIVSAVEQEAAEKIALKEAELAELKKASKFYQISSDDDNMYSDSVMWLERKGSHCFECSDVLCHRPYESLENLKISAHKQFKKLKKDIDEIKGSSSMKRKSSSSELLGLSGILEENMHDKWVEVDRTIESLRNDLDSICNHTEGIFCMYESSFCQRQQESQFQSEIEGMVVKNCMVAVLELLERRGWVSSAQHSKDIENYQEKIKEISSLRKELDVIFKSLSAQENGHVISHGSLELQKAAGNHISPASSLCEGNGKHDDHIITEAENFDLAQLKHLLSDELAPHFKEELLRFKRHYEEKVRDMTEYCFSLKREYLKERGPSLPVRKDKEFDMLRKKIPDVIQKLDTILVESEKIPALNCNTKSHDDLSARVDSLLSENCQLRELLAEKEKEIKCLSVHVSDASRKQAEHSMTESKLLGMIQNLKWAKEDLNVEHFFNEDLCKFLLKEALGLIYQKLIVDDDGQGNDEVASGEATMECDPTGLLQISDSDMEDAIVQGLYEVIFREAYRDAEKKLSELRLEYDNEVKLQLSLETELLEKEKALALIVAEKDRLEQSNLLLELEVDEKGKSVREAESALAEQEGKFKVVSEELSKLKAYASLLSKSVEESKVIKSKALQEICLYEREHCELRGKFDLVTKQLNEVAQQNCMLIAVSQGKDNALNMYETREKKHRNQLDAIIVLVRRLSATIIDFKCLAAESIRRNCLRVEILVSQLGSLIPRANQLRKMAMTYKQRLERRSSDLQKAEAEVDLLGDEVDALLSLLEKIYIALDHYSPVLQHYPGVIEILKLVRRELSGEALKSV